MNNDILSRLQNPACIVSREEVIEEITRLRAQLEHISLLYFGKVLPMALPTILNNLASAVRTNDRAAVLEQISYLNG